MKLTQSLHHLVRALSLLVLAATASAASAETRVALVIGNSAYVNVAHLPNPANDASLVGRSLQKAGFDVEIERDLNAAGMRTAIQRFAARARNADVALVYYAGHGMEMNGTNYLIPVDARLNTDTDVSFEAVALDQVMSVVRARRLGLVILDACRNNPFASSMSMSGGSHRAVERGLARVEPIGDTLVVYAAKDGDVSEDGEGADSPFATALSKRLDEPGVEVGLMFREVRDDVLTETANRQQPFTYGSLGGAPFFFVPSANPGVIVGPAPMPGPTPIDPKAMELAFWQSVGGSNDIDQLNAYLRRYPGGDFAEVARAKIASLSRPAPVVPTPQRIVPQPVDNGPRYASEVQVAVDASMLAERQAREKASEARLAQSRARQAQATAQDAARRADAGEAGYQVVPGTVPDGETFNYKGQTVNGQPNGYGVKIYSGGVKEEGQFKDNNMSGLIVMTFPDSEKYEGEMSGNNRNGVGVDSFADGDIYQGEEVNNKMAGLGLYTAGSTRGYTEKGGQWSADKFNGYGLIVWKDGSRWIGAWTSDSLSGQAAKLNATGQIAEQGRYEAGVLKAAAQ